jgi:sorting nexin-1/2
LLLQFTSFKVTTSTKNPKYKSCNAGSAIVMRRFSEFYMLFRKIRTDFPGTIVPPCPEKNQLQKLRKSPDFIETRRQALEVFMNKICCHRVLKHSDLLRTFLEADEPTWQMEMQRMKQSEEQSTMFSTVTQLATDIVQSTKNLAKGQSDDKGEDPEYLQVCWRVCRWYSCTVHTLWIRRCSSCP